MNEKKGNVLIVDDNTDVLLSLKMLLRPNVNEICTLTRPDCIEDFMDTFQPDVILLDMNFTRDRISGEEGYYWLGRILRKDPQAVVLFITAYVDTEKAVRAIKAGAIDFIPKPWDTRKLVGIVTNAIELRESRRTAKTARANMTGERDEASPDSSRKEKTANAGQRQSGTVMLGNCTAIQQLRQKIETIAATEANVLITGENGTGKDVAARMLHELSGRRNKPFVAIDLGSMPETLFETELFGHEKGAFTDAKTAKEGRIEIANGGTLFLDEIGNLSPAMQQKLLTVLEKHEVSRIGSTKTIKVDLRIVAATNANLQQMMADGRFRQDLFYRLNTIDLYIPPLRQRGQDILLLAEHFGEQMSAKYGKERITFSPDARQRLMNHSWPGNVRELLHTIERAVVMCQGEKLTPENLQINEGNTVQVTNETLNLAELEKQAIMRAIELSNGNLTQAADILGISRYILYRKINKMEK